MTQLVDIEFWLAPISCRDRRIDFCLDRTLERRVAEELQQEPKCSGAGVCIQPDSC